MAPHIPFLVIHIAAGFLALAAGSVALATEKGRTWHRRSGRVFVWAMFSVAATAFIIATLRPSAFLFSIGVFSLYLGLTGWRAAVNRAGTPRPIDWTAAGVMLVAGAGMIGWGAFESIDGTVGLAPVLIVFGGIGGAAAISDLRSFRGGGVQGKRRIVRHLSRMIPGMIAATTAFVVVNGTFLPPLVAWLGPALILSPFVAYWRRRTERSSAAPG